MVWLFDYSAPTFIVLLFFTTFYFLRPVFITQSNRYFLVAVILEFVGFIITFLSSFISNNYSEYNKAFLQFVNNAYYLFYLARYVIFPIYIASVLHIKFHKDPIAIIDFLFVLSVAILVITNPFTNYIYDISPLYPFKSGEHISLIYYANISTLVVAIYFITKRFKKLEIKAKMSIIFSIVVLFGCCITDIFYMDYLVSDMFFLLVLCILFLTFENPDIYRDKMTNIFNLEAFRETMNDNLYHNKDYKIFGFVIKNFQELRQIYGTHHIELVLKEIGEYLLLHHSNLDFYYLQNGKFTVICHHISSVRYIEEQIVKRFEQGWTVNNGTTMQLKIVIVNISDKIHFETYDQMQANCQQALFEAEKSSKNSVLIDKATMIKTQMNSKISQALINALNTDTLEVYLQPIMESSTRKIVAAEALVRILDKDIGLICPDSFIEIAEQNGYIELLSEQVLNKVCIFLKKEGISKYHLKWINVNLSPLQCLDSKLIYNINTIVRKNDIDPKYIHLEITEDCMINKETLKTQMQGLIDCGYYISLDDFGSGFSNLSLIKALPFNNIKLDMGIVKGHFISPDIMLPGLVGIFRKKGLSVTAEGVETKEMADELISMGCDYLQGYYMSKPLPIKEFVKLIEENPIY